MARTSPLTCTHRRTHTHADARTRTHARARAHTHAHAGARTCGRARERAHVRLLLDVVQLILKLVAIEVGERHHVEQELDLELEHVHLALECAVLLS